MRFYKQNILLITWLALSISTHTFGKYGMPLAKLINSVDNWYLFVIASVICTGLLSAVCLITSKAKECIAIVTIALVLKLISMYFIDGGPNEISFISFGVERSVFGISIPFIYFVLTSYYAWIVRKATLIFPLMCVAGSINDFADEAFWSPYGFYIDEVSFMSYAMVLILILAGIRHFKTSKAKSHLN